MSRNLPPEIFERIIDAIPYNTRALISCSFANRAFVARSRVHLFRKITLIPPFATELNLAYPITPTRCDRFAELLAANPYLAYHVQELELVEGGHPRLVLYWISQSTTLLQILRKMHNLRSFVLRYGHESEWSDVLREVLFTCIHLPSVDSVELSGFGVDTEELFSIVSGREKPLGNLRISNLLLPPAPLNFIPPQHLPLQVDSLDVTFRREPVSEASFISLLSAPLPLIAMDALRHLRLTSCYGRFDLIERWLHMCAGSLETLELIVTAGTAPPIDPPASAPRFVHTPHLRSVRFVMHDASCTPKVARIIAKLRSSTLSVIQFSLSGRLGSFDSLDKNEWSALNAIITRTSFPSLNAVQIDSGKSPLVSSWEPKIRQWLPNLDGKGLLVLAGSQGQKEEK